MEDKEYKIYLLKCRGDIRTIKRVVLSRKCKTLNMAKKLASPLFEKYIEGKQRHEIIVNTPEPNRWFKLYDGMPTKDGFDWGYLSDMSIRVIKNIMAKKRILK